MRLYKNSYRDKNGQTRKTKKWYLEFKDHHEKICRWPTFSDKALSMELGRKLEKLVYYRITGEPPAHTIMQWLETLPKPIMKRITESDLLDSRRMASINDLQDHLEDFKTHLIAKGNSPKQVNSTYNRIRRIIDGCKFITWTDISGMRVQTFLHGLRKDTQKKKGISRQTYNFYLQNFKQFCKWMVQERRATESPVAYLQGLNVKAGLRHERRALTVDEVTRLTETVKTAKTYGKVTGEDRFILYRFAIETGLRQSEIRSLTVSSFTIETDTPFVTVKAAYAKNGREDSVPLRAEMVLLLNEYFADKQPKDEAFKLPRKENVSKMMKKDLEAAGIAYRDTDNKVADFHALRHTCGTWLMHAGVHAKIIQRIMRHSTITLTMDRYTHVFSEEESAAVESFPELNSKASEFQEIETAKKPEVELEQRVNQEHEADRQDKPNEQFERMLREVLSSYSEDEGAKLLGALLGATGTKTCDLLRVHENEALSDKTDLEHEKTLQGIDIAGFNALEAERAGFEPAVRGEPVRRFSNSYSSNHKRRTAKSL